MEVLRSAGWLLWTLDPQLLSCVSVSLVCSLTATALAVAVGVPAGMALGGGEFAGRHALMTLAHTGMAVPTVVVGLVLYCLLSRSGPLGATGVLYTKGAIIIGEFCLALPIVVSLFGAAVGGLDRGLWKTARTLGAGPLRTGWLVLGHSRTALTAAAMAALGRVVSELGVAVMIGGNIRLYTRTMTTAIALETQKGQFALALALGLILLVLALGVNVAAQMIRGRR